MNESEPTTSAQGTYATVASHVPIDLATKISALARRNDRSVSGEIRIALRKHLADEAAKE